MFIVYAWLSQINVICSSIRYFAMEEKRREKEEIRNAGAQSRSLATGKRGSGLLETSSLISYILFSQGNSLDI